MERSWEYYESFTTRTVPRSLNFPFSPFYHTAHVRNENCDAYCFPNCGGFTFSDVQINWKIQYVLTSITIHSTRSRKVSIHFSTFKSAPGPVELGTPALFFVTGPDQYRTCTYFSPNMDPEHSLWRQFCTPKAHIWIFMLPGLLYWTASTPSG